MSYFSVDILTPNSVLAKDLPAESLKIPTYNGEINVLREHTHIVTTLGTGVLSVEDKGRTQFFLLTSGMAKVLKNKVTILARAAEKAEDIDRKRAQVALQASLEKLNNLGALDDGELEKYRRKVARAEARIRCFDMI